MVGPRWRHKPILPLLALAPALLVAVPADARRVQASVARVEAAGVVAEAITVTLDWPDGAAEGALELAARRVRADALDYELREPRWTCTLRREPEGYACAGQARAHGFGNGRLSARQSAAGIELALSSGNAAITLALPAGGGDPALGARALPADWLQPLLDGLWPEAHFTGGTLAADLVLETPADGLRVAGKVEARALGLDTDDGRIAAAGLGLDGTLAMAFGTPATSVDLDAALRGGELLARSFYAALPEGDVRLSLAAEGEGGRWRIPRLRFEDRAALVAAGVLALDLDADEPLQSAALEFGSPDLALANARYLSGVLGMAGLAGLELGGAVDDGSLALAGGRLQRADAVLRAVSAVDQRGRFSLQGLDGSVGWRRDGSVQGALRWASARLYALPLGPASVAWRSADGGLALREPAAVPLFGGALRFERLAWQPARQAEGEASFSLALALEDIALEPLTRALDWPAFGGTLSGRIPEARYEDGVLMLDGGLQMQVFDGRVAVGALRMERAFGVAPTLVTDLALHDLDLVPLTRAFGFGEISGRLEGRILGLRLVDWEPVAFDAELLTSTTAPDRRRISQRAVSDLSSVGGSGLAGGLQAQLLSMFETFPYRQIGLRCRLENNVCTMGGIEPAVGSGGYTIVEGSGLPRITVVGHQRRVDWPVLVGRLKSATAGQAPVVD